MRKNIIYKWKMLYQFPAVEHMKAKKIIGILFKKTAQDINYK